MRRPVALLFCLGACASAPSELDTIAARVAAAALPAPRDVPSFDLAVALNRTFLVCAGSSCNFSDVDYGPTGNIAADYKPFWHISRTLSFATAFASPSSRFYNDTTLLSNVHALLSFWLTFTQVEHHASNNWWFNQVGILYVTSRLGLVLEAVGALTPGERAGLVLASRAADTYAHGCEPTNCMWLAENVFLGALLERNATIASRTMHDIYATIAIINPFAPSDASGIKSDASFMMHGALLYNGGYGMCYAKGLVELLSWTAGSACCALPHADARWDLLSSFVLDGSLRMIHYGSREDGRAPYGSATWDPSALGRNIVRPYGHDPASAAGQAVTIDAVSLANVGGPRAADFLRFSALINGTGGAASGVDPAFLSHSALYWVAGYATHTRALVGGVTSAQLDSWTASAFAASSRTRRSEITNAEGIASWHLAEHTVWVQRNGTEFLDVFPALDWQRLPGTTVLPDAHYGNSDVGGVGVTAFVGGASDGRTTVFVNDFVAPNAKGLSYRKATAFFDSAVVTLAANITAADGHARVWSTLEQRRSAGGACVADGSSAPTPVAIAGAFTSALGAASPLPAGFNASLPESTWWVWEGGIGYVLLDRAPGSSLASAAAGPLPQLHASSALQRGSWRTLGVETANVTCAVFALWLEHSPPVVGASTGWVIVPAVSLNEWASSGAAAAVTSLRVLTNTAVSQAVLDAPNGVLAAAIYEAGGGTSGDATPDGWAVSASAPVALVLRDDAGSGLKLSAANPAAHTWTATVDVVGRSMTPARDGNCSVAPGGGVRFSLFTPPSDGASYQAVC